MADPWTDLDADYIAVLTWTVLRTYIKIRSVVLFSLRAIYKLLWGCVVTFFENNILLLFS